MNTLNIFAIILIVSFVNTAKSPSFSDIAQSFVQLHDAPEGLAKLHEVTESFQNSHNNLEAVASMNQQTCEKLNQSNLNANNLLNKKIQLNMEAIQHKQNGLERANENIEHARKEQEVEQGKIKEAAEEIEKLHHELVSKENELTETMNVLYRLRDVANDELAGKTKITTEMGKYNVVNNHGVSFIQKSNLKQELSNIMNKTHTAAKSLISTLILLASNDDAHYSDPKLVAKVIAILDKIINENSNKLHHVENDFHKDTELQSQIIQASHGVVANLEDSLIKENFVITFNTKAIDQYNREIEFLRKALKRREDRAAAHAQFCKRQADMMATYERRYSEVSKRMNELRAEFSEIHA